MSLCENKVSPSLMVDHQSCSYKNSYILSFSKVYHIFRQTLAAPSETILILGPGRSPNICRCRSLQENDVLNAIDTWNLEVMGLG